jgi:hypothetical protein
MENDEGVIFGVHIVIKRKADRSQTHNIFPAFIFIIFIII